MKIYLIRHGQRGRGKDFDTLTNLGKEQSRRLGNYFKGKKIDFVYCSPQKRARDTLNQINPFLKKSTKIKISNEVRQQSAPEEVGEDVIKLLKLKTDTNFELDKRVQKFIEFLKEKHKSDSILISTHKQFVISAICRLLNLPPTEKRQINKIHSASVTYFELDNKFKVKDYLIGDMTHLVKFIPNEIKKAQKSKISSNPTSIAVINNKNKVGIKYLKLDYPVKQVKKDKKNIYFEINFD